MLSSMMVNLWEFVGIEWDITIYNQQKSIMASWEILERHWQFSMEITNISGIFELAMELITKEYPK